MKEVSKEVEYKGEKYKIVFNLNVMEEIQAEYGTLEAWGALTDLKGGEPDAKAVILGLMAMINEGIDIDNEGKPEPEKKPFVSHKFVGRMLTDVGLSMATESINDVVIESVKDDSGKNV